MYSQDITNARTLPSSFYRDKETFHTLVEAAFRTRWQFLGCTDPLNENNAVPVTLLPGLLDEPLLLTRDNDDVVRCLSNVCTHRGSTIVAEAISTKLLRCPYHGRCFELNGHFRAMAGFEGVRDFPNEQDDLPEVDTHVMYNMIFGRLAGQDAWSDQFADMLETMQWFPWQYLRHGPALSRDYDVHAHWMLYVENYLEGLHVPFVHPSLNTALKASDYHIDIFKYSSLQLGVARDREETVFDLPADSPWHGQRIYAFYWFVFPNMMFNFYPWGISLNVVEPVAIDRMRVRFITFVLPGAKPDIDAIHQTELEDEAIVERVQRGVQSSFYKSGRYAPQHEKAVHHFHGLVQGYIG